MMTDATTDAHEALSESKPGRYALIKCDAWGAGVVVENPELSAQYMFNACVADERKAQFLKPWQSLGYSLSIVVVDWDGKQAVEFERAETAP